IDFDGVHAVAKALLGGVAFDWPREGTLSLKIARALVAGVEAKQAEIDMRSDANGFEIARFAIADFGGATLAVKGRIDATPQSQRGAVTLDLDARALDGILALLEKLAPQAGDQLRRSARHLTPLTLRAALAVDTGAGRSTAAKVKIDGRAGTLRVALQGEAGGGGGTISGHGLAPRARGAGGVTGGGGCAVGRRGECSADRTHRARPLRHRRQAAGAAGRGGQRSARRRTCCRWAARGWYTQYREQRHDSPWRSHEPRRRTQP